MPTLVYRKGGRPNAFVFGVHDTPVMIGRGLDCTIVVDDGDVSRKHAEIFSKDDGVTWRVRDLTSANGSYINGERIEDAEIRDGDTLRLGTLHFEFRGGPDSTRVPMPRNTATFRNERSTPIRSLHAVGEHFRVHEGTPAPLVSSQDGPNGNTAALYRRVRELERRNQRYAWENRRLRETLSRIVEHTDIDEMLNGDTRSATDIEKLREQLRHSVSKLHSSAITMIADVVQSERRKKPLLDRVTHMVTRTKERQRATTDDED